MARLLQLGGLLLVALLEKLGGLVLPRTRQIHSLHVFLLLLPPASLFHISADRQLLLLLRLDVHLRGLVPASSVRIDA